MTYDSSENGDKDDVFSTSTAAYTVTSFQEILKLIADVYNVSV